MPTATKAKSTLKLQPFEDRVVIAPTEEAETMRGGLYIPDTAKEKPQVGEILAIGPGKLEKGQRITVDEIVGVKLAVGDKVVYGRYSGSQFPVEGDEVILIKATDVLAKLG
jgi:chaperonin GroES